MSVRGVPALVSLVIADLSFPPIELEAVRIMKSSWHIADASVLFAVSPVNPQEPKAVHSVDFL